MTIAALRCHSIEKSAASSEPMMDIPSLRNTGESEGKKILIDTLFSLLFICSRHFPSDALHCVLVICIYWSCHTSFCRWMTALCEYSLLPTHSSCCSQLAVLCNKTYQMHLRSCRKYIYIACSAWHRTDVEPMHSKVRQSIYQISRIYLRKPVCAAKFHLGTAFFTVSNIIMKNM
jgi:hypothetical protein